MARDIKKIHKVLTTNKSCVIRPDTKALIAGDNTDMILYTRAPVIQLRSLNG